MKSMIQFKTLSKYLEQTDPPEPLQSNLSTKVTLGTEESGYCEEVAVVKRLKEE